MINKKEYIKKSSRAISTIALTFGTVCILKAGPGSYASGQTSFNPSVSTISTNVISEVTPYTEPVIYIEDDDLFEDESVVTVQGTSGIREEVMEITTDSDKVTVINVVETKIIKEAVASEIHIGTKVRPQFILPVRNYEYSYGVGYREDGFHKGMDLLCPSDSAVYASAAGVVTYADWMDGYGYLVSIDHGDGFETRYAHMNEATVSVGDTVEQGQQIGWSGSTGDSECPHVHMEMYIYGEVIDPVSYGYITP